MFSLKGNSILKILLHVHYILNSLQDTILIDCEKIYKILNTRTGLLKTLFKIDHLLS